jgi:hypothetical protein
MNGPSTGRFPGFHAVDGRLAGTARIGGRTFGTAFHLFGPTVRDVQADHIVRYPDALPVGRPEATTAQTRALIL